MDNSARVYFEKKIHDLEQSVEDLRRQLDFPPKDWEPEIDWSKMAGRLVMVRDGDDDEWLGPFVYSEYSRECLHYPHVMNHENNYRFCKPYTGPTRPNWIEWRGGECPVNEDDTVLIQHRNGNMFVGKNIDHLLWRHAAPLGSSCDIMRYTVIEP